MRDLAAALGIGLDELRDMFATYPPSRWESRVLPRLRPLRVAARLTLRDLASAVGVVPATVSSWERGKAAVPDSRMAPLAAALGCTMGELLTGAQSSTDQLRKPLADLRIAAGLRPRSAARRLGLTQAALGRLEFGVERLDEATARRMALLYGCGLATVVRASHETVTRAAHLA
jgi:transcriptional regulator with XRE-family HTH domain